MLKKTRILTIIIILCVGMCSGCTSSPGTDSKKPDTPVKETTAQGLSEKDTRPIMQLGQPVTVTDFCEFTLDKVEFTTEVIPSRPADFYTYYQVKQNDRIYLHIIARVKNLQPDGQIADTFADVEAKYDNKYQYTGFCSIEESGGGDLTYSNITNIDPLTTAVMHYIIEVPKEVETSGKTLELTVSINGEEYLYKVR
ncbi:MAG: hypothetical protein ACM3PE_10885 [Deltaproteobacteria bacterium]